MHTKLSLLIFFNIALAQDPVLYSLIEEVDHPLKKAIAYLHKEQQTNGSWDNNSYTTALSINALLSQQGNIDSSKQIEKAFAYLYNNKTKLNNLVKTIVLVALNRFPNKKFISFNNYLENNIQIEDNPLQFHWLIELEKYQTKTLLTRINKANNTYLNQLAKTRLSFIKNTIKIDYLKSLNQLQHFTENKDFYTNIYHLSITLNEINQTQINGKSWRIKVLSTLISKQKYKGNWNNNKDNSYAILALAYAKEVP